MAMRSDRYLPLFPLGVVLAPHMPMPLHIFGRPAKSRWCARSGPWWSRRKHPARL